MAESERRQAHLRAWGNGIEAVILNIVQGAPPLAAPRLEWMVPGRTSKAKRLQAPPALALKFWSQCELNGDGRARRPG